MASSASGTQEKDVDSGLDSTPASASASASASSSSLSSLNEQGRERQLKRKQRVYYDLYADVAFHFNDGETINFNRSYLAAKSDVFHDLFAQVSSGEAIEIQDYDTATFKLFLDSLLGIQKCSVLDVLMVFPIAWKYQTDEFIYRCVQILKPEVLNENVCLSLNLALFCNCMALTNEILNFFTTNQIYKIFGDKKFYSLLEPESVAVLLEKIKVDSFVLFNVFKWGKKYLQEKKKSTDLKSLFKEHGIMDFLKLSAFETTPSIFFFNNESKIGKNFFDSDTILQYLNQNGYDPRQSRWSTIQVDVEEGEYEIVEKFVIPNVVFLDGFATVIHVTRNPIVFYDYPSDNGDADADDDQEDDEQFEGNEEEEGKNTKNSNIDCNKETYLSEMICYGVSFKTGILLGNAKFRRDRRR